MDVNIPVRQANRIKKRHEQIRSSLVWSSFLVGMFTFVGFFAWTAARPYAGVEMPIMEDASSHILVGDEPGEFNTDPPTSGNHYGQPFKAGFYEESDPETQLDHPESYLLHSLEHGYVIFWYNCDVLKTSIECGELKDQIQSVMGRFENNKLIAFPWPSIDSPVVMTSWGYMQRFGDFDEGMAQKFVKANLNRAPEPNAP